MVTDSKKIFKNIFLAIFILFIVIYSYFRVEDLVFGVKIEDVNIVDGEKMDNSVIDISGNAKNAVKLSLNGREISTDQEGNFKETIALLSGYNRIDILALDKFGNRDEKYYQLMH